MFIASNETIEVFEIDNSFTVDKWSEVNTPNGWIPADKITVGDKLIINEDNIQSEIIVIKIDTLVDNNQIVYYY